MSLARLAKAFGKSVELDPVDRPRPAIWRMVNKCLAAAGFTESISETYERQRRERDTDFQTDHPEE